MTNLRTISPHGYIAFMLRRREELRKQHLSPSFAPATAAQHPLNRTKTLAEVWK